MKNKILSCIFMLCLFISCVFFGGCTKENDPTDPPATPVNEVTVMLSDDGKTLYRFSPDNDETEYTVPEGVIVVEQSAFEDCDNLIKVVLPTTIQYVKEEAFKDCDKLTTVEINSDIAIGTESFYGCEKLSTIDISKITSFGLPGTINTILAKDAFYDCNSLTSITIAKEVEHLPEGVFGRTTSLTTVNFEEASSLYSIGVDSFAYSGITSIAVPNSCIGFNTGAFRDSSLTSITIGKNITTIALSVFNGCKNLTSVEFETGRTETLKFQYNSNTTGGYTFANCSNLMSVTNFPAQSGILDYMFYNCKKLETFTFANEECDSGLAEVNSVCESAFYSCENLKEIHLPKYLHSIERNAFSDCKSLKRVSFVNLALIQTNAFSNCDSLMEIDLDVFNIERHAFYDCNSLSKIIIRDKNNIDIDENAFSLCYALFEIYNLSNSLELTLGEEIAKYAKDIYTALETQSKIKSVNNVIYYDNGTDFIALAPTNTSVTNIEFDSKTTEINMYAFVDLDNLASITIQENIAMIGDRAFYKNSLETVIINSGTISNCLLEDNSCGDLLKHANTIYIKTGLETAHSTYLVESFIKQTTSNKIGYDMYVRQISE